METNKVLERQAAIFKALGHPVRLRLVKALVEGARCVCELHALVDKDMSTVSRHLSILHVAGVVRSERRGTNMYYSLALGCLGQFLSCSNNVIQHNIAGLSEEVSSLENTPCADTALIPKDTPSSPSMLRDAKDTSHE